MLDLTKHLAAAKSSAQKGIIQSQLDSTDAEIDRLVINLYGLTADEIALWQANGNNCREDGTFKPQPSRP